MTSNENNETIKRTITPEMARTWLSNNQGMRIPHTPVPVAGEVYEVDVPQMFRNFSDKPVIEVVEATVTTAIRELEQAVKNYAHDLNLAGERIIELNKHAQVHVEDDTNLRRQVMVLSDKQHELKNENHELKLQVAQKDRELETLNEDDRHKRDNDVLQAENIRLSRSNERLVNRVEELLADINDREATDLRPSQVNALLKAQRKA